jgi:hypothetical protein
MGLAFDPVKRYPPFLSIPKVYLNLMVLLYVVLMHLLVMLL